MLKLIDKNTRDFTNRFKDKLAVTAIILLGGLAMTACNSAPSEKAMTGAAQNSPSETSQPNLKETPKLPVAPTNGLPEFKKGDDYKSNVRVKMLKEGWKPARTADADQCGSGDSTCDEYPEMENCAGTGLGNCKFRWQKGEKIVALFSIGDPKIYDGYEFEKASKTTTASTVDQKWESFWAEYKAAINQRDTQNLRKLMADDFFDGGGGGTADEWVESIQRNNSWNYNQKSIAGGTKIGKCDVPCRSTKDGYLLFSYTNGKWLWTGLGGEGGEN